jgi:PAS domain S-box-containing protein
MSAKTESTSIKIKRYALLLAIAWTVVIVTLLLYQARQVQQMTQNLAKTEARAHFNKDQAFRFWGASHGGIYVPTDERTPPNPYLSHVPERDIQTPSGKKLTLMNPAYMVRQMNEEFANLYGIVGHITSFKLLRPDNAPDEWERSALLAFERGVQEVSELTQIDGKPYLRFMRPMFVQKSCLKCHGHLGYKVGDVRGGVGIALPMGHYIENQDKIILLSTISLCVLWLLGIGGIIVGTRSLVQHLQKRFAAEEKIRQLSTAVEQSPSTVVITDIQANIEYVNPKFTQITGYTPEEVIGQNPHILKSGEQSLEFYQAFWNTILSGEEWRSEFHNKKKNGTLYWESASISCIKNAVGKITHFVKVAEDITERKRAEEALKKAKEDAELASRAKSEFIANMSHEIRTPLNAVLGFSELLSLRITDSEHKSYLDAIGLAGENLLMLINDVLDLAKIEAGHLEIQYEEVNLEVIFDELKQIFALKLSEKNLVFVVEIDEELPYTLMLDEIRLRQVLLNLVGNAIKFTEKGSIKLDAQKQTDKHGKLDLIISVADTGIGIPENQQDRIFETFQQLDGQSTRKYGGTGLGLALCKRLVKLMNGHISVESKVGGGSIFEISLPDVEVPE